MSAAAIVAFDAAVAFNSARVASIPPNNSPIPGSPKQADPVESKKANHRANLVRITEILPHGNADNLLLVILDGYQVVVRKGEFAIGDLAVYIQPDSVVPRTEAFRFFWEQYVGLDGFVPEKRRRITVRKFRGEWSEGLLMTLFDLGIFPTKDENGESVVAISNFVNNRFQNKVFRIGDDVSEFLGITHYDPDTLTEATGGGTSSAPRRKYPKTLKGLWYMILSKLGFKKAHKSFVQEVSFHLPEYDVESFKNHPNTFEEGEAVVVTEKIHGSNARFISIDGEFFLGSRTQWKKPDSGLVWQKAVDRNEWIKDWCLAWPGYALYGEVTPTQGGYDYGDKHAQFFLFDILDPNGRWVPFGDYDRYGFYTPEGAEQSPALVPVLYVGPFKKDLILSMVDGPSTVEGAKHIREGIVVKSLAENGRSKRGRKQLKIVSNAFLHKDSK